MQTHVGADSISARKTLRRREPGGYLRPKSRTYGPVGLRNAPAGAVESAPTQVSRVGNARRSRLMRYIRNDRRAGCPHPAAPRGAANTRGRAMALSYKPRQVRGQPENHNLRVITTPCRGTMLASSREPRAAANAPGGYGIRPYNGFSAGRASGLPVWPVVAGRHVGEGHAPPANPAPETRGLPGICGTYKMTVGRDALIPPHPAPAQTPAGGISGLRAAAARRLASETRLRAQ